MGADYTITTIERLEAQEGTVALALGGITVGGRPGGIAATVETGGLRIAVTKLDGETEWIADAVTVIENGYPVYANGAGVRYTKLKAIKDEAIIAALDEAAALEHDCQEEAVPYESDGALGHGLGVRGLRSIPSGRVTA